MIFDLTPPKGRVIISTTGFICLSIDWNFSLEKKCKKSKLSLNDICLLCIRSHLKIWKLGRIISKILQLLWKQEFNFLISTSSRIFWPIRTSFKNLFSLCLFHQTQNDGLQNSIKSRISTFGIGCWIQWVQILMTSCYRTLKWNQMNIT